MEPLVLPSSRITRPGPDEPRNDVEEVARALGAGILAPAPPGGVSAPVQRRLRVDLTQARQAVARRPSAYLTWSERIAVPVAVADRRTPHATFMHALDSRHKRRLLKASGLPARARAVGVFCEHQAQIARTALRIEDARLSIVPYTVDERFFAPGMENEAQGDYVLCVGRERRDWGTLAEAVEGTGIRCIVVGSSPWSVGVASGIDHPAFERRSDLTYAELRSLYAGARVVVVPVLRGVGYAAGLTALREAQAMHRPVIVSDVPGLRGSLPPDNGVMVTAGDPSALRRSLLALLEDSSAAERMGAAGGAWANAHTFDDYVAHMASMVQG